MFELLIRQQASYEKFIQQRREFEWFIFQNWRGGKGGWILLEFYCNTVLAHLGFQVEQLHVATLEYAIAPCIIPTLLEESTKIGACKLLSQM